MHVHSIEPGGLPASSPPFPFNIGFPFNEQTWKHYHQIIEINKMEDINKTFVPGNFRDFVHAECGFMYSDNWLPEYGTAIFLPFSTDVSHVDIGKRKAIGSSSPIWNLPEMRHWEFCYYSPDYEVYSATLLLDCDFGMQLFLPDKLVWNNPKLREKIL